MDDLRAHLSKVIGHVKNAASHTNYPSKLGELADLFDDALGKAVRGTDMVALRSELSALHRQVTTQQGRLSHAANLLFTARQALNEAKLVVLQPQLTDVESQVEDIRLSVRVAASILEEAITEARRALAVANSLNSTGTGDGAPYPPLHGGRRPSSNRRRRSTRRHK